MRITHAYCVELKEVVTIDRARREYLSTEPTPPRYTFLCSDEGCREKKVIVSGVNYTFSAEEFPKRTEAHFRAVSPEKHLATCEWRAAADADALANPTNDGAPEQQVEREAKRKLTDLITEFDPRVAPVAVSTPHPDVDPDVDEPPERTPRSRRPLDPNRVNARTRTRDLERMVQTYREARDELPENELRALHINVIGVGRIRLIDYFQPLQYCNEQTRDRIITGGAHFDQHFGQGFRLRLIDKVNDLPVYVYVAAQQMEAYRYRKYLRGIVDRIALHRYVRVYVNGSLKLSPSRKSYNLEITHLDHLALVLGPKLEPKITEAP